MIDRPQMTARYESSRGRFLEAMKSAGGALQCCPHPLPGPCGEALFMDVGVLGSASAKKLILITSGTHGIEGYLGSELQAGLLASKVFDKFLSDTLLVFVHGVNPYGMAWHRRVNENNVDLNRNFMDFNLPLPYNKDYDLLSDAVNPAKFGAEDIALSKKKMAEFLEKHGLMQYIKALSGGQYHNPRGVQYGGSQAEWSNVQLNTVWKQYVTGRERVVNIDLHSGLGNRGEGIIMLSGDEAEPKIQGVNKYWNGVMLSPRPTASDFIMSGVLGNSLESKFTSVEIIAAVLEFGTQEMEQVAGAMIADNWLHHYGDINSAAGQAIKQQLFDAFYIDDDSYRAQVYARAEEVVGAALQF